MSDKQRLTEWQPGRWSNGYLRFDPDTCGWQVRLETSPDDAMPIGSVRWFPPWTAYTFRTRGAVLLGADCLGDIARFCEERTAAR